MGRLFWKFFLFFWLAQIFTVIGVGLAIWLLESGPGQPDLKAPPEMADRGPFPPQPPPWPPQPEKGLGARPPPPPGFAAGAPSDLPAPESAQFPPPGKSDEPIGHPPPKRSEGRFAPPLPPLVAGSLVSLLFALMLARYFVGPIRALQQAFESVANGRMDTRVGHAMVQRNDELADLGSGFDNMAERLQGLMEGKQRLLHDVSHELRSPLARMQAAIDLMQQQPERIGEFIERIERESGRIDRLVGELLTLARLDSDIPGIHMEVIDLKEMIETIAADAAFEAESKRCHVSSSLPEKTEMMGNPDLLHRAIENIVRNGIRHTPEGGKITIVGEAMPEERWFILKIMDNGEGVPESDLKLIFEPFYRSPTADRFKGYGIGMALTRRVVDAHKGKVAAANRRDGGLVVTIELPILNETAY
ncbi:MAG: HAMP domain-containing sensor histidine kinase [Candidatus Thiodiazotropha sp.]